MDVPFRAIPMAHNTATERQHWQGEDREGGNGKEGKPKTASRPEEFSTRLYCLRVLR